MKSTKEETKMIPLAECGGCQCNCGCKCGHQNYYGSAPITRWILGLIVVVMIFSLGLQVGEMKGWIEHSSDYPGRQWSRTPTLMMGPALDDRYTFTVAQPLATTTRPR